MAVDERARHQLFAKLEELLGPEDASTLIVFALVGVVVSISSVALFR